MDIPVMDTPPKRVVSLVPSMTESLFDLGMGEAVVGITDYCTDPPDKVEKITRVGGTKNPRVNDIVALKPDLVIMNQEENTRQTANELEEAGLKLWVTFPRTVRQSLSDLWILAWIFRSEHAVKLLQTLEKSLEWAELCMEEKQPIRYFCPIWQEREKDGAIWWMTFNKDTYPHDLLHLLGGENVFANREKRYPLEADLGKCPAEDMGDRDVRYPRVTLEEICNSKPDLIILPDEPFNFAGQPYRELVEELKFTPAVINRRVYSADGRLLMWHGTHLAQSLMQLPSYFMEEL